MNSDMVKPEKFGHLHLVYHFTVPLKRSEVVSFADIIKIAIILVKPTFKDSIILKRIKKMYLNITFIFCSFYSQNC